MKNPNKGPGFLNQVPVLSLNVFTRLFLSGQQSPVLVSMAALLRFNIVKVSGFLGVCISPLRPCGVVRLSTLQSFGGSSLAYLQVFGPRQ